jgi:hypothetical protein
MVLGKDCSLVKIVFGKDGVWQTQFYLKKNIKQRHLAKMMFGIDDLANMTYVKESA